MTWGQRRTLVIVIVIVAVVVVFWTVPRWSFFSVPTISGNSELVLDLSGPIVEQEPPDISNFFLGARPLVLHEIDDAIDQARSDSRIRGLIVRIAPMDTGWAKLEEIHQHLLDFRSSGKPSICYLGYDGEENEEYYVATGCDQVWLTPMNTLDIRGMMAEATFLRSTLDKLHVVPNFLHIAEFKTATNEFTEKKFTPAHREEVTTLLNDLYNQYLDEVSSARHISRARFAVLVQAGPFLAQDALQDKIVDRVGYWDQVEDYFRRRTGAWNPTGFAQYRQNLNDGSGPRIAIIYASGEIASGASQYSASGGEIMGGDSVAADIRRARTDSGIRAIILRVDSPGGSSLASEVIRREVQLAQRSKPVVVSMSDLAASGGYWISMSADKIVADPDTITASIGVLSGKMNIAGLYQLLGVSTDYVATGDNATLYSAQQNFSPAQQQTVQKMLDDVYANFTEGVASGRHLPISTVDQIAKGRVWSGERAKGLGLVDELGDTDRAIEVAKQLANIPANESVELVRMPRPQSFFDLLFSRAQGDVRASQSLYAPPQLLLQRISEMVSSEPVRVQMPFTLRIR